MNRRVPAWWAAPTIGACLAILVAGCVTAESSSSGPGAALRADRPRYALGDRWIRHDGVFEVIRVERDLYVFAADRGREIHLSRDLALVRYVFDEKGTTWQLSPPPPIGWPLEVGQRGSSVAMLQTPHPASFDVEVTWHVVSYEDVRTPAGTFAAYGVSFSLSEIGPSNFGGPRTGVAGMAWSYVMWYAPAARRWIKGESSTDWQLHFSVVAVEPEEAAPVDIVVQEPRDQLEIIGPEMARELTVRGRVSAANGLARVTVSVNGETLFTKEPPVTDPSTTALLHVPGPRLREGKNLVLVTASDRAGTTSQEARTVIYVPRQLVHLPPPGARLPVAAADVLLKGTLAHPAGIAWAMVLVDGSARFSEALDGKRQAVLSIPLTLRPGDNRIEVRMQPIDDALITDERILVLDTGMRADRASSSQAHAPDRRQPAPATGSVAEQPAERPPAPAGSAAPSNLQAPPPPLRITIAAPEDKQRVEQESVVLAAVIAGGRGVRRVVVTLNGTEVARTEEAMPRPATAVDLPIRLREGQNTIVLSATDASGLVRQDVRTVYRETPVPLALAVRHPPDQLRVAQPSTVVVVQAVSSRGVSALTVTVNGKEVERADSARRDVALATSVALEEGTNLLLVTAVEAGGTTRHEVRTVIYDRPPVAAPAPPTRPAPERWAVVIGAGEYQSPAISPLRYAVNDAELIFRLLTGPAGFRPEHVLLLSDRTERKPTLRNIKWALGTFLARSARRSDTVLIFFAGHGAPEVDRRGAEADGLAKYLVPVDADPDDLFSTALPMDDLDRIFSRIEAERVVAFFDTCYSGAAGGRTFTTKTMRAGPVDDRFLERLTRTRGRVIISASRSSEVSFELQELGHGIFTYYLAEALRGAADANRDGIVTLQEVYEFVEREVGRKARAVGGNQNPVMKGELEGALPLVKIGPR